jgi:outer membrane protein TolC
MRTTLRGFVAGLLTTSMAIGCAPGLGNREDALWREYRDQARATTTYADAATLFAADAPLDRAVLVSAVLARNPTVAAAREGLRGMLAEIPMATALDDPMVGYEIAPLGVVTDAPFGHVISVSQKLPFPGKRRGKGQVALARAEVEAAEIETVRLELAQMASELYDDYFVSARAREINTHHRELYEQMKRSAEIQFIAGRGAQQDPIQAEVELARLEAERITIEAERDQVVAQLNRLLHRAPEATLPPPPDELVVATAPAGTSTELQELALRQRPQREASAARIRAARGKVAVAERAFFPDFEVMGSYNSMWDMPEHRWMVGVSFEVPIQREWRRAAVEQAESETTRARFEDDRLVDEIRVDVDRAYRRVTEAQAILDVHVGRLIPAARAQLDAARAGFTSGQNSFLAVVEAQKNLRESELELVMARAELSRRRAALASVVGNVPGIPEGGVR